jgi:hypothetical protein
MDGESAATNNGTIQIKTLEVEYKDLCEKETELLTLLQRLKREEESLSLAVVQVGEPVVNKQQQQQRETLKRLEEALMQDSTSSSSSSSDEE